jgi:HEPN domain-containing protein
VIRHGPCPRKSADALRRKTRMFSGEYMLDLQMTLDALLNDFAIRSFRDTGDGDYIAARLAFRYRLVSQFLWSALQAIEKYMKCVLLLNRIDGRKVRHDLSVALDKIERAKKFELRLSKATREFIEYLDTYGRHRYFETPYHIYGRELVYLDLAVWEVRRYCTVIDYRIKNPKGEEISMLEHELQGIALSEKHPPQRLTLLGGQLERIIADPKHPSREPLLWQNGFFGKKVRKRVRLRSGLHVANSPPVASSGNSR